MKRWVLFLLLFSSSLQADNLLNSAERPTIMDFLKEHRPFPKKNPYTTSEYRAFGNDQWSTTVNKLPSIIAQLESAFPGQTYAFLGRDSAFLYDAITAFYLSIGQKNRTIRLDISGSSIQGVSEKEIVAYLEGAGLTMDHNTLKRPGVVILDGTKFQERSQSRVLLRALYNKAAKLKIKLEALSYKLNVVSTAFDGYAYYPHNLIREANVKKFLEKQAGSITENGPKEILSLDCWVLTHGYEWHGTFGKIYQEDGKWTSRLGAQSSSVHREAILANMYRLLELVGNEKFLKEVKQQAADLGFEFQVSRKERSQNPQSVESQNEKIETFEQALKRLKKMNADTESYKERKGFKLTESGFEVLAVLEDYGASLKLSQLVEVSDLILNLKDSEQLGDRDARRLIRYVLSLTVENAKAVSMLSVLASTPDRIKYLEKKVMSKDASEKMDVQINQLISQVIARAGQCGVKVRN